MTTRHGRLTRHGRFAHKRVRLLDQSGRFVEVSAQVISQPLRRSCLHWSSKLPFSQVQRLLQEQTGERLLSEDTLWRICQSQALALDEQQEKIIEQSRHLPGVCYQAATDIYDPEAAESVVFTDAIGVKAQKPTRQKVGEAKVAKTEKRHDTDVMILPRPDGGEHFVCEGVSNKWSMVEAADAYLKQNWSRDSNGGNTLAPLVALTDGAKTIRADLLVLFGENVRVILDWYHLKTRVYQNLSMVAHGKKEREGWQNQLLPLLWHGKVEDALKFLAGLKARNASALSDLVGYLTKHSDEIIDYERRQQAGKPIGSGRMEKGVDQVIGRRQKGKGMSWTKVGSRALALLTCAELNARPTPVRAGA